MWQKRIQWFKLKINKSSVLLIKKIENTHALLFSSSLVWSQYFSPLLSSSLTVTSACFRHRCPINQGTLNIKVCMLILNLVISLLLLQDTDSTLFGWNFHNQIFHHSSSSRKEKSDGNRRGEKKIEIAGERKGEGEKRNCIFVLFLLNKYFFKILNHNP